MKFRIDPILLLILLLALLYRLALWAQPLHQPANDEREYIAVAYDLLAGRGWAFYESYHWLRAPLYPLYLAGSLALAGGDLHRAALPSILLSTLNVGLIALLTHQLGGSRRAVRLAAGSAAVLLTFATFASLYMAETLFTALFTGALVLLLHWRTAPTGGRAWGVLAAAACCYGLAVLTRSLPLAFLPVVLLWVAASAWQPLRWRALLPVLVFGGLVLLTIAPWTLRNCRAYSACITVETGFSYNMWAFNEPRESMQEIFRTLEQIPDPAERAAFATDKGIQRLQEDPAILARKLLPNWVYLWRVKPIQDRFLMASYYADPPPLLFLWALLADDLLYLLILIGSVGGVAVALWRAWHADHRWQHLLPLALPLLWVAYVVVATMLTHGEARYRHFFFSILIPFAAIGATALPALWQSRRSPRQPLRLLLVSGSSVLLIALLHTVTMHYPWEWAQRGAGRSWHTLRGDLALARGDALAAETAYRAALRYRRTADSFIALGNAYLMQGNLELAHENYRKAQRTERLYIPASTRLGDVYRRMGQPDAARQAFAGTNVSEQAVLAWAWQHLQPPPRAALDVGSGLDIGYVRGVYPAEQVGSDTARWTDGHAHLRLRLPTPTERCPPELGCTPQALPPPMLGLRVAAPHPTPQPVPMQICVAGQCQQVLLQQDWQQVLVALPDAPPDATGSVPITLRSPTFAAPDGRTLGVLLDQARMVQAAPDSP